MRDRRGIKAAIGDRVFYVTADGTHGPTIHEAWAEKVDQARILVRMTASPLGGRDPQRPGKPLAESARELRDRQAAGLYLTDGVNVRSSASLGCNYGPAGPKQPTGD